MSVLQNNRGVALILTILVVSLIVAFTIQFNRTMRAHLISSVANENDLKALYTAKSGLSFALALLKANTDTPPDVTTLFELKMLVGGEETDLEEICGELGSGTLEDTGSGDTLDDTTIPDTQTPETDRLSPCSLGRFSPLENCDFEIIDECGKIQLNSIPHIIEEKTLQNLLLESYLRQFGLKQSQYEAMGTAYPWYEILDWIDTDEEGRDAWGSSDVNAKNGPLRSLQELRLIEELNPDNLQEIIESNEELDDVSEYVTGEALFERIIEHLTIFEAGGDNRGKVNINTASREVLISLFMLDPDVQEDRTIAEEQVDLIVQFRCGGASDSTELADPKWYKDDRIGVQPDIEIPPELITTDSQLFRIHAEGTSGDVTKRIVAVVKRGKKTGNFGNPSANEEFNIVSWTVE